MTTRKKKPFWTKLLSALLIACMLVGTAGTSSLAAAGDPGDVTEADAVSSDSSNGDEETTPAADTTNTDVTPSDKADPSAPKTNLPEGAGDNALLNANGTQTGTSGEGTGGAASGTTGTSDTDQEQDDSVAPGNGGTDEVDPEEGLLKTDTVNEAEEIPEEEIAAAVNKVAEQLQDLGDRFGAFQEEFFENLTGDEEDPMADFVLAAAGKFGEEFNALLEQYRAIPAEVTKSEYAETYAELEYALENLAVAMGGDLNSGVDEMALLTGEEFRIQVNYGYLEGNSFHLLASKTMTSTCRYGCGHSGYNHTMSASEIVAASGYSGDWRVTRYGYWDNPASTTNCNYNITGSAPYKADQTIWVYGEKPTVDTGTPGGDHNDPGGYTGDTGAPGNKQVKFQVQVVYHNPDGTTKNGPSGYAILPCNGGHSGSGHNYSCNPSVSNALSVGRELHQRRGQPDVYTQYIGWKCGYYVSTLTTTKTSLGGGNYNPRSPIEVHYQAPVPTKNTFTLTYNANGGTVKNAEGKDVGSYANKVETTENSYEFDSIEPNRDGYRFLGWYTAATGGSMVTWPVTLNTSNKTKTVYAHWEQLSGIHEDAKVIYKSGEGNGSDVTETVPGSKEYTIKSTGTVQFTAPTGKVFSHWEYQNSAKDKYFAGDKFTPADGSTNTFVAIWKNDDSETGNATYTVSWYDAESGSRITGKSPNPETRKANLNSPVSVTEEDKIVSGYTFKADDKRNVTAATLEKSSGTELKLYFIQSPGPALNITKSVDKPSIKKGEKLTYTIKVENTGKGEATNVVVTDELPSELTYVSKSTSGTSEASATGNSLKWELGTIKAGSSVEFTFKAEADETGRINNVTIVDCDEKVTDESDSVPTAIYDFAVTKKNDGFVSEKGSGKATVHYTVTVTNNGKIDLYGLNIKDVLTPEIKIDNAPVTAEQAEMTLKNVKVSGADGTLSGGTLSVTDETTTIWNSVIARGNVFGRGEEKKVTLEYDIEITNKTKKSIYVNLNNTATCGTWTSAPSRMRSSGDDGYVEESAGSSASTGTSGTGGTIDPAVEKVTITVKFVDEETKKEVKTETKEVEKDKDYDVSDLIKVPDGYDEIVKTEGEKTGTADADKTITVTVKKNPKIEITKTADKDKVKAGDMITYTITVKNVGKGVAKGVEVTDVLDSNLNFENWKLDGGTENSTAPVNSIYNIGDMAAGATNTLSITTTVKNDITVTTDMKIVNTATADYTNKPKDPGTLESKKEIAVVEENQYIVKLEYVDDSNPANVLQEELIATLKDGDSYTINKDKVLEELSVNGNHYIKDGKPSGSLTGSINGKDIVITIPYTLDNIGTNPSDPTDTNHSDGVPDKYQAVVTFAAVNGKVTGAGDDGTYKFVVTFVDANGDPALPEDAEELSLTDAQIPETMANTGYSNGVWDVEPNGAVITGDTTFTIRYSATTPTTPTTPPGGGGGNNDDDDDDDDDDDPTPTPSTPQTPGPTPIIPGPVPTVGPTPTVVPTVTPVAATPVTPTPTAALVSPTPEAVELADEAVPLAAEEEKEQPEPVAVDEEETPLAGGKGAAWALINFALMNLAIFESVMLLIGYFVKTKNDEEEEKRKLKKKGIFRVISLPIAIISLIVFILTEDITLPTAFVDKYTIVMLIIAIVQTVMVALSNKKYEDEEEV